VTVPPEGSQDWVSDARAHGLPVMVTGVLLLTVVLGLPLWVAGLLVLIPMTAAQVAAARSAFPMPEADWPHG
jgi:type IV secretory pathway TrbD component